MIVANLNAEKTMKNVRVELPSHAHAWMHGEEKLSEPQESRWRDGFSGREYFLENGAVEITRLEPGEALYLQLLG